MTAGMLYPVLYGLMMLDHVDSRWHQSDSGRRRVNCRIAWQGRGRAELQRRPMACHRRGAA